MKIILAEFTNASTGRKICIPVHQIICFVERDAAHEYETAIAVSNSSDLIMVKGSYAKTFDYITELRRVCDSLVCDRPHNDH